MLSSEKACVFTYTGLFAIIISKGGEYQMDINQLSQLIGSLGFPIVCVIILFRQNGELQKTLSELSTTLTSLTEKIQKISEDVDDLKGGK